MRQRAPILLALLLVLVTVALALLQCGAWDGTVNGDGVSYLDLARLYSHGRLSALANGYWSPLYPMLLAAVMRLTAVAGPQPLTTLLTPEMRVVFAVNVLVMAGAAAAFGRLLIALHRSVAPAPRAVVVCRVLAASALFVWCMIRFIGATSVTPDALLATWLLLVAGELVDATVRPPSTARTLRIAVFLAAGYWTKAVFFPVAALMLGAYLVTTLRAVDRAAWRAHLARGLAPLLLLVAPLVVVQSASQHRLSFGETGRLNYRWYVLGAPHAAADASNDPRAELATDASSGGRQAAALPLASGTTLYRGDVAGTFPYWFDPSRFEPRDAIRVDARAQWERLAYNAHWYRVVAAPFVVLALIALAASLARGSLSARMLLPALPAAALIVLDALTHVEGRLAGPPILLLLVLALHLSSSRPPVATAPSLGAARAPLWRRASLAAECIALLALGVLALGRSAKRVPTAATGALAAQLVSPAAELRARGLAEGSAIGIVGSPYGHYWAHQAGVRLAVVTQTEGRNAPMGDAELAAIARESCAQGAPLGAIVGHQRDDVQSRDAVALASGWWIWRPPPTSPCTRVSTR
ncbi:MAG TPA: hypothetical protein VF461_20245 [Gemmatimonadaceae bacterium]